jgi:tetratricopeptide (TPR) repeat protein
MPCTSWCASTPPSGWPATRPTGRPPASAHAQHYAGLLPDPAEAAAGGEGALDAEVENLRAATDWLIGHAGATRLDAHLARLWPLYQRRGWFREAQAVLTAALEHAGVPVTERARWHRLLGQAYMELGEVRPARQHFERTLALLGSSMPASTLGWLDVLASQALQRRLWRLRPGGVVERGEERRIRAGERAATCWQMGEACYVLEDWSPLLPLALFGLNQAEGAGRPDLTARAQIGVGLITGIAGLRRLSRRQVRAAVSAADRAGDPVTICWTQQVGGLYWLGVGDWIDVVRAQVAAARFHLAGGRPADAWRAIRTAADLAGPGPSFASYTLEAHAGLPEVCLALLERGEPPGVDPAELRATAAAGLRRLRRYARSFPMARPRALVCLGWSHWLQGRHGAAHRAWTRAIREAERLSMPWELANAHHELGRHLAAGQRSPLGLDRTGHLDRARSTFAALGCRTDPDAGRQRP